MMPAIACLKNCFTCCVNKKGEHLTMSLGAGALRLVEPGGNCKGEGGIHGHSV